MYGTTYLPPGSLLRWSRRSVCLGVYLPLPRCLVRGGGYGEMVGDPELGLGLVILSELSDKALPGMAASEMTEFWPLLKRPQSDALRT